MKLTKKKETCERNKDKSESLTCELCRITFRWKCKLKYHLALKHGQNLDGMKLKLNFTCEVCGKSFGLKKKLEDHIAQKHERKFSCEKCGKSFGHL